MQFLLARTNFN